MIEIFEKIKEKIFFIFVPLYNFHNVKNIIQIYLINLWINKIQYWRDRSFTEQKCKRREHLPIIVLVIVVLSVSIHNVCI